VSEFDVLYAEKCRQGLDLTLCQRELAQARQEAAQAARQAERQRAHLQRRIDALVRKVRAQHAQLNPPVEYVEDPDGMWSWCCNGGPGCIGWVGHHEHSKAAAELAWASHVKREHQEAS
jgi:hypothetical protein